MFIYVLNMTVTWQYKINALLAFLKWHIKLSCLELNLIRFI